MSPPRRQGPGGAAAPRPLKIAFVGFRHGHIGSVYQAARASAALEVT